MAKLIIEIDELPKAIANGLAGMMREDCKQKGMKDENVNIKVEE